MGNLIKLFFICVSILIVSETLTAQVSMVKDPNPSEITKSSFPRFFTEYNNQVFFKGIINNREAIFKIDPQTNEAIVIKGNFFQIYELKANSEFIYFIAAEAQYGKELWRSDGTEEGTELVKDITSINIINDIRDLYVINNKVVFKVHNQESGVELWVSDGTEEGTALLMDIEPGSGSPSFSNFISDENFLYFIADNSALGEELWRTDGTENGTIALTSLNNDSEYFPFEAKPTIANGNIYFTVYDLDNIGYRIWQSDGSVNNTSPIDDHFLAGGFGTSKILGPLFFENELCVLVRDYDQFDPTDSHWTIWKKSLSNTAYEMIHREVTDRPPTIKDFLVSTQKLFVIIKKSSFADDIWSSGGTSESTLMVAQKLLPYSYALYKTWNESLFYADAFLWKTDGSIDSQTQLSDVVLDFRPNESFSIIQNKIYFGGQTTQENLKDSEVMVSEGTAASTMLLTNVNKTPIDSKISNLMTFNSALYFGATNNMNGIELWKSDGTAVNTNLVKDILPEFVNQRPLDSNPMDMIIYEDKLFFSASILTDGIQYNSLWESDGTEGGTVLVKNIDLQKGQPSLIHKIIYDNKIFFSAREIGECCFTLWSSDGTEVGTVKIEEEVQTPSQKNRNPHALTESDGKLYFIGFDNNVGWELWHLKENNKIEMIKDINPGVAGGFTTNQFYFDIALADFNGNVFFSANDGVHGAELWTSDGTEEGTIMLKDILPGESGSTPNQFTLYNDELYFFALTEENGRQLWKTDGTSAGTQLVQINANSPLTLATANNHLFVFKDFLYFSNYTESTGFELWQSDGTDAGTFLYNDLIEGQLSSSPRNLTAVNDILYFNALDDDGIIKTWKTTGDGEIFIIEEFEEIGLINPENLYEFDGDLYFSAIDPVKGESLFKYEYVETTITAIDDSKTFDFAIYPNPTLSGKLVIKIPDELMGQPFDLSLLDLTGRKLNYTTIENNNALVTIQLHQNAKGLYLLQISNDNYKATQRVFKN